MIGLVFIVVVSYLVSMANPHTVAVCNVVATDGKSVELFAGTYHIWSEFADKSNNFDAGLSGGIILTDPNGYSVRYEFTSKALHSPSNSPTYAPTCGTAGSCACDGGIDICCPACLATPYNKTAVWQAVTVTDLADGTYTVTTTQDDVIESPSDCAPWQFTVTGSIATKSPAAPASYNPATPSPIPTSCVCDLYQPGNYTKSDGSGCLNEYNGCYDCDNGLCTCHETGWCAISIPGGITTIFIVIIVISVVCGLCCIGLIIYCICAAACCCAASASPKKGGEAQMNVITPQTASPNTGGQTQPTEIITATAI